VLKSASQCKEKEKWKRLKIVLTLSKTPVLYVFSVGSLE